MTNINNSIRNHEFEYLLHIIIVIGLYIQIICYRIQKFQKLNR